MESTQSKDIRLKCLPLEFGGKTLWTKNRPLRKNMCFAVLTPIERSDIKAFNLVMNYE